MKTKRKTILAENYRRFFKQNLISESAFYEDDGWNTEELNNVTGIIDALAFASEISYELDSARRGSYAIKGNTVIDLVDTIHELIDQLNEVVSKLEDTLDD
jgi:hypothetical protein